MRQTRETRPVDWLLRLNGEALIQGGDTATLIYGRDGHGKSTVAVALAAQISEERGPVVFVAAEDPGGIKRRALAYARNRWTSGELDRLYIYPLPLDLTQQREAENFTSPILGMHPRPVAVVIDPWADCLPGVQENDSNAFGKALKFLWPLREQGIALIIVHHSNASGTRSRGHSILEATCGTRLKVGDKAGRISLSCEKQRNAPKSAEIHFDLVPVELDELDSDGQPVTAPVAVKCSSTGKEGRRELNSSAIKVLRLLSESDGPVRHKDLTGDDGVPKSTLSHLMCQGGELDGWVQITEGHYVLTETARAKLPKLLGAEVQ